MQELHTTLFMLIIGSGAILLGRWLCKNPKSIYPNWMLGDSDHPALLRGVRVFATVCIFVGSSQLAGVGALLLPESWAPFAFVLGGIIGGWYLRPNIPESTVGGAVGEALDRAQVPQRPGFLSNKGKWELGGSCVLAVLCLFALFTLMGDSEVCQLAIQRTQSNAAAIEQLGTPIRKGLVVSGNIQISGPSGHANIAIPVSGPKAKGTLYVVGAKSAGIWRFEALQLALKGNANRIDLLNGGQSRSAQP